MSPTYSYRCPNCEKLIEEWHSISQRPESITCQACGGRADRSIEGGQGFLLKGSGWNFDRYAGPSNFHFPGDKKDE